MTQRERHTTDGGTASASPATLRPAMPSALLFQAANPPACLWEELYQRATASQQDELLALAARQGVLYVHQIAPPDNGNAVRRPLLPALLNGQIKDLQPLRPPSLQPLDDALDAVQIEAVRRALYTSDICLIQGLPGTGKSRVVAEIIHQAAARGERVLLLAPGTAPLDRVLEQVGALERVYAIRCLTPQENMPALPPCIRRLTVGERVRHFKEQTLPAAQQAAQAARQRCDELRGHESVWVRLDELLATHDRLTEQVAILDAQRERLPSEVERDAAALEPVIAVERTARAKREQLESRRTVLRTEIEKNASDRLKLDAELQQLTPLADARRAGRWWSLAWWRALGQGDVVARSDELRKRHDEGQVIGDQLAREQRQFDGELAQTEEHRSAECARLLAEEQSRRRAALDEQLRTARQELQPVESDWHGACRTLAEAAPRLPTPKPSQSARAEWSAALTAADEERERAQQWAEGIASAADGLADRIARCANLVAVTTNAFAADPHFGDKVAGLPPFDLLILEDADQVTESEFVNVARRGRRWVLVGEPMADAEASDALPRRALPGRPLRPAALRPGFFQRLWQHLHADPRRLPCAWFKREGRLVCRLRPLPPDQQTYVETESVADRPEIELRIVSPPRQLPHLVEVVFPDTMSIYEAKDYIVREIGEPALQAHGARRTGPRKPISIVLHLSTDQDPDAVPVDLGQGVRELVGCLPADDGDDERLPWHTCGLAFDKEAGWTLERARPWVEEQLKLRDLGRTAFLGMSYRMRPALARVLSDILSADDATAGQPRFSLNGTGLTPSNGPCLEFISVPTLPPEPEPHHRNDSEPHWQGGGTATVAPRPRTVRGGAGLEVDLADPRHHDPLPADVRAQLPKEGYVNFLEAQAVVRRLETLIHDPDVLAAAAALRCPQQNVCHADAHCPAIAVMALCISQVELLRCLMQRSPALAASPVRVEVGLPSAFCHRDCHVAVLSLTRSHTHRAVTYADHPRLLLQALTRARAGVHVFGDPGTLARRSQWQGPVDHLDESAAAHERSVAAQLLRYIQGHGSHSHAFQFREGSSV